MRTLIRDDDTVVVPSIGAEVSPDPQSLDATRPDDLDACVSCDGYGAVLPNPRDPASIEDCRTCGGTGERVAA